MTVARSAPSGPRERGRLRRQLVRWFDAWDGGDAPAPPEDRHIEWLRVLPFLALHASVAAVALVGWSPFAVLFALGFYALRMFAITAFYHRYFSHRAFRTSRALQLVFALLGATAVQRGPLWWAAHHRAHHRASDGPGDVHSPVRDGFWWSHVGWFLARGSFRTRLEHVRDLARFPELCFLDRFDALVPLLLIPLLWCLGAALERLWPEAGTSGAQLVVWGFSVSTVLLYHGTFAVNSVAHRFGRRRYATRDQSRNGLLLALLTFGEGWHNNHHHYPASARQGFFWWEVDLSWYLLRILAALGLVWDLKPLPAHVRDAHRRGDARTPEERR